MADLQTVLTKLLETKSLSDNERKFFTNSKSIKQIQSTTEELKIELQKGETKEQKLKEELHKEQKLQKELQEDQNKEQKPKEEQSKEQKLENFISLRG